MNGEPDAKTTAKLIELHDAAWQLGVTLRCVLNRLETIKETHPDVFLDIEIARCKHSLSKYSYAAMIYTPNPFGLPYDDVLKKP